MPWLVWSSSRLSASSSAWRARSSSMVRRSSPFCCWTSSNESTRDGAGERLGEPAHGRGVHARGPGRQALGQGDGRAAAGGGLHVEAVHQLARAEEAPAQAGRGLVATLHHRVEHGDAGAVILDFHDERPVGLASVFPPGTGPCRRRHRRRRCGRPRRRPWTGASAPARRSPGRRPAAGRAGGSRPRRARSAGGTVSRGRFTGSRKSGAEGRVVAEKFYASLPTARRGASGGRRPRSRRRARGGGRPTSTPAIRAGWCATKPGSWFRPAGPASHPNTGPARMPRFPPPGPSAKITHRFRVRPVVGRTGVRFSGEQMKVRCSTRAPSLGSERA